jgi:hypothetical protein
MTPRYDTEPDQGSPALPLVDRRRVLALPVAAAPWLWAEMSAGSTPTSATTMRSAFFPEPGASDRGFYVVDGPAGRLLSGFEALGGLPIVGRPIGRPYPDPEDGSFHQPFERMLLRWNQETEQAEPVALLDALSARGLDRELRARHGVPMLSRNVLPIPREDARIHALHTNNGGAETFGYARSTPRPVDQAVVQRFQNAALQHTGPDHREMPAESIVRPLSVGTWAGELGLYPEEALLQEALRFARFEAPRIVRHGDPTEPLLYLTLDDCWSPEPVEQALDIAAATGAKLTFFPVGAYLEEAP